ncbi:glycosyltransferase [Trichlorobacter ammonificans]|uniref:Glycosyltransferase 2-like domain-containing protein n=1 Tax=Trichlorobacter ammonificans TaxID=2916410 RepID=A0ABM9D9Z5_9BACT|nr:glycosyltransferase [Trichlorobacter ammonificans]CAH2032034.1 conserved membrane protein of unknown function [Trichlorobacter ammonificans]
MISFSIVIPVKPGVVPQAVKRLSPLAQSREALELLVAEGTCPSRQRNEAVRQARGEIVYFLDDDSLVPPDCLQRLAGHFADPAVAAVGGPSLTPTDDSLLQRAIGAALASPLGAGGVCNRYRSTGTVRRTTERELILCNLAVRREVFLACGGFDERLYPNEENEFLDRLAATDSLLLHDPLLTVQRSQRASLTAFLYQMFRYGRGRAQQTRIAGVTGIMPFAPLLLLLYLLSLPLLSLPLLSLPLLSLPLLSLPLLSLPLLSLPLVSLPLVSLPLVSLPLWRIPLLLYAGILLAAPLFADRNTHGRPALLALPLLIPLLHLANGAGLLAGFLLPMPKRPCYKEGAVTIRRIPCTGAP